MRALFVTAVVASAVLGPARAQDTAAAAMAKLAVTLPRAVEESLALSAAPEHLRSGAAVYVYGKNGYERVRDGGNGFTCLVNRDAFLYGSANFKPTCWDAQGATTYVPVMLKVGELLARGEPRGRVEEALDAGFASGMFHAPTTGGVAYMLAGDVELDPATGRITRQAFPGHYMFYALGATNAQLGTTREAAQKDATLPSVFAGGAGGAHGLSYLIAVPGDAHRMAHPAGE